MYVFLLALAVAIIGFATLGGKFGLFRIWFYPPLPVRLRASALPTSPSEGRGTGLPYTGLAVAPLLLMLVGLASTLAMQTKRSDWVPLQQDVPRKALDLTPSGPKAVTDLLHLSISMPLRDPEGMKRFADSVSDPASPNYRHFASPEELGEQFGLPMDDVQKVCDYLVAKGMKIKLVAKSRQSILADATVAQAQEAFHTSISEFSVVESGKPEPVVRFAFTKAPYLPAAVRPFVTYVGGLENMNQPRHGPVINLHHG